MAKKESIENTLSTISGVEVEVNITRKNCITLSFEGKNEVAAKKIQDYFAPKQLEYDYDEECDFTCLYMNL